jgi:hypothetical protein
MTNLRNGIKEFSERITAGSIIITIRTWQILNRFEKVTVSLYKDESGQGISEYGAVLALAAGLMAAVYAVVFNDTSAGLAAVIQNALYKAAGWVTALASSS